MTRETPEIVQRLKQEEQNGNLQLTNLKNYKKNQETRSSSSNNLLKTLIQTSEKSKVSILIANKYGVIKHINERFSEKSGFSKEEVLDKNATIFFPLKQSKPFMQILKETILSGNIWTGELQSQRKDESTYWMHSTIIPVYNQQKQLSYFMSINQEVTQQKEIEQSLKIKENAILSSINAIVLTDLSGKITSVNPSFLKMWSFDSEKKVIGKPVFSLWKKGGQYMHIMDTVIQEGGWLGEVMARSHSGRLFPVQMSASIVKDDYNKPLQLMASFVDITRQKRMEKNFKKFKKISDEADYGSVIYDLQGTILYGNDAFSRMHGYLTNDLIGKKIDLLFSSQKKNLVQQILSNLKTHGKIIGNEEWHIKKNGSKFPLLVTSSLIDNEQFHQPFVAGTMIDITKMKEAENQIIEHVEEVKMMNQELNIAKEKLATLNQNLEEKVRDRTAEVHKLLKQKDEFISQLGHDLRTPLTPMLALLPLLEKRVSDEKGEKYISMIQRNIFFMKDLVNKTITYAKLNSDNITFSFTEINVSEFINDLQNDFYQVLKENQGEIKNKIKKNCVINADLLQLKEVFHNLISNAIKYRQENKPLIITLFSTPLKNNQMMLSVKDNGIGMTEDQLSNVFYEFYKADDARTDVDSHGLGLNICKRIVEKHGGKIWAESKGPGKGSTFSFTVDIVKEPIKSEQLKNKEC
ncbi:MAG TPA: PAS domain S-box protein [Candidatus Thermoplasmatota archaeon]|nr:PAS domain S-box protein [Candidatus Thermoplasmatota archaeon]